MRNGHRVGTSATPEDKKGVLIPLLGALRAPGGDDLAGRVAVQQALFPVVRQAADDLDVADEAFATSDEFGQAALAPTIVDQQDDGFGTIEVTPVVPVSLEFLSNFYSGVVVHEDPFRKEGWPPGYTWGLFS